MANAENKYLSIQKECNDWYLTVENYEKNLQLYKKALGDACIDLYKSKVLDSRLENAKDIQEYYLIQARKELKNDKTT